MSFPAVIGKETQFWDSSVDPPPLVSSLYHNLPLDLLQTFYTLLTSLNARTSRGLGRFQSLKLVKSAEMTSVAKGDRSRVDRHAFENAQYRAPMVRMV